MADEKRLKPFQDLKQINDIVVNSKGAYNHKEAFELDIETVYSLTLLEYETAMLGQRFNYYHKAYMTND